MRLADLPVPETGPDEARQIARDVMADFEWGTSTEDENWLQSLARSIAEGIGAVLDALFGSGIVTVLMWAALLGLVGWVLVVVLRRRRSRPKVEKPVARLTSLEASRRPHEWRSEAEELEARGEWKLGLRARYRSLVSELIHAKQLRDVPGRTTGEFRIELADRLPQAAEPFAGATDLFDRAWYGDRPTGPPEAAEFERRAAEVLGRVPA